MHLDTWSMIVWPRILRTCTLRTGDNVVQDKVNSFDWWFKYTEVLLKMCKGRGLSQAKTVCDRKY